MVPQKKIRCGHGVSKWLLKSIPPLFSSSYSTPPIQPLVQLRYSDGHCLPKNIPMLQLSIFLTTKLQFGTSISNLSYMMVKLSWEEKHQLQSILIRQPLSLSLTKPLTQKWWTTSRLRMESTGSAKIPLREITTTLPPIQCIPLKTGGLHASPSTKVAYTGRPYLLWTLLC